MKFKGPGQSKFNHEVFWKESFKEEKAKGGIFRRTFDLNKFLEKVEETEEIVGLKFFGKNLEIITRQNTNDGELNI
jgi:hypothetical protein